MVAAPDADTPSRVFELTRAIELSCFALCVAQAVFVAGCYVKGYWLVALNGALIPNDFVNVWAAGQQALAGHAAAAYDVHAHKLIEDAAIRLAFAGEYPWNYPPTFLFVATAFALLPLVTANIALLLLTFPLYLTTLRAIIGERSALLLACAFPGIVPNVMAGQNGFVTAALIGGALLFLERRPLLAGCLIGCLSFKPHFGLLFPLVLIAGGHWRAFAAAAVATLAFAAASSLAFGMDTWVAFLHALPATSQSVLTDGSAEFGKMQSLYALVRMLGGSESLGWTVHGMFAAGVMAAIVLLWRSRGPFDLKAAGVTAGALLVTPYLFMYDLAALAVPMAFLIRMSLRSGDTAAELLRFLPACALLISFTALKMPVGFVAIVWIALLIARRLWVTGRQPSATKAAFA